MSPTFIAIAFLATVLLVNWRLVLLVVSACLIALLVMGLGVVDGEAAAEHTTQVPTTAPADPGQASVDRPAPGQR